MHGKADIHGTIQVGRGFGFAQSRAGDFVSHADIIGTGWGHLGASVDTLPTGTAAAEPEYNLVLVIQVE